MWVGETKDREQENRSADGLVIGKNLPKYSGIMYHVRSNILHPNGMRPYIHLFQLGYPGLGKQHRVVAQPIHGELWIGFDQFPQDSVSV